MAKYLKLLTLILLMTILASCSFYKGLSYPKTAFENLRVDGYYEDPRGNRYFFFKQKGVGVKEGGVDYVLIETKSSIIRYYPLAIYWFSYSSYKDKTSIVTLKKAICGRGRSSRRMAVSPDLTLPIKFVETGRSGVLTQTDYFKYRGRFDDEWKAKNCKKWKKSLKSVKVNN